MSQDTPGDHVSTKRVVYHMPGTDRVTVRGDVEFRGRTETASRWISTIRPTQGSTRGRRRS